MIELANGRKPRRPQSHSISDQHWKFIEHCWSPVQERPAAERLVSSILDFLRFFPHAQSFGMLASSDKSKPNLIELPLSPSGVGEPLDILEAPRTNGRPGQFLYPQETIPSGHPRSEDTISPFLFPVSSQQEPANFHFLCPLKPADFQSLYPLETTSSSRGHSPSHARMEERRRIQSPVPSYPYPSSYASPRVRDKNRNVAFAGRQPPTSPPDNPLSNNGSGIIFWKQTVTSGRKVTASDLLRKQLPLLSTSLPLERCRSDHAPV